MSSRKSRLSLTSDVRKDAAAGKTSNACVTPSRPMSTKHTETRSNDDGCDVSPSQSDYSPVISLTQDNAFHAINGVSWRWNSPQRFPGHIKMKKADMKTNKPLLKLKTSEASAAEAPKQATGFNKFISKLNLLMGQDNVEEKENHSESTSLPVDTLEENDFFISVQAKYDEIAQDEESDDDIFQQHYIEIDEDKMEAPPVEGTAERNAESRETDLMDDELDDSKLDRMLIEASQTVEQHQYKLPQLPPPTVVPKKPESNPCIAFDMNDSDMDGFLVQASLMVEEKLSDSSQDSTSFKPAPNINQIDEAPISSNRAPNEPLTTLSTRQPEVGSRQIQPNVDSAVKGGACTREISMSQEDLKALLEKKRQEALQRLQNNRLRRAMKGTNSNG